MFPEFDWNPAATPTKSGAAEKHSPEEKAELERGLKLLLKPEERARLERLLLSRLVERKKDLDRLWTELNGHWGYEDGLYRF